jgi:DNA-binding response OmpR family regulator
VHALLQHFLPRKLATILVVEDDASVRELIRMQLAAAGHTVAVAEDGADGLEHAIALQPDLIVADVRMPKLDGFGMLAELRKRPETAATPLIFLSALEDRESLRRGMNLGADDFLTKPVQTEELLGAVATRLQRSAAVRRQEATREVFDPETTVRGLRTGRILTTTMRNARVETALLAVTGPSQEMSREVRAGTVLVLSIRNGGALVRGMSPASRRDLMTAFFGRVFEPVLAQNGWVVQHDPTRLVAMFESAPDRLPDHALRAMRAALLAVLVAQQFRIATQRRNANQGEIEMAVGIALASGDIEVSTLAHAGSHESAVSGEVVDAAIAIEQHSRQAGWSVCATGDTFRAAGSQFAAGASAEIELDLDAEPAELVEVAGFSAQLAGKAGFEQVCAAVGEALGANSRLSLARGTAGETSGGQVPGFALGRDAVPREIPEYRIIRKLGKGGMSRVYLAVHEPTSAEHVLKVINIDDEDEEALQRFLQEYALIAQIRHPNVARIHGQGFAESCAYIAMEYFSGGDLRDRIDDAPLPARECLRYLAHTALALTAIHERGIVHRDLKPENLMLRHDRTLVLADFGIAKQLSTALTRTHHGEVFGTPHYMSPEQAQGLPVDPRTDLYSLGIILYEMLVGERPFCGASGTAVAYQHIHEPVPPLPGALSHIQPIVDRLLAKQPDERFPSAIQLLRAVREIQLGLEPVPAQAVNQ